MERRPDPETARPEARTADDRLRERLASAPVLTPPEDLWRAVEATLERRRHHRRRWYAFAAVVLLAAGLGPLALKPSGTSGARVAEPRTIDRLIEHSRHLERRRHHLAVDPLAWNAAERGLALRIADLDDELWRLGADPGADGQRLESLWATRVELLETLIAEERASGVRPALY